MNAVQKKSVQLLIGAIERDLEFAQVLAADIAAVQPDCSDAIDRLQNSQTMLKEAIKILGRIQ